MIGRVWMHHTVSSRYRYMDIDCDAMILAVFINWQTTPRALVWAAVSGSLAKWPIPRTRAGGLRL